MAKIFFITRGCSVNQADSEAMQGLLSKAGHEIIDKIERSDLIIFNTCTVKSPSENKFKKKFFDIKRDYPKKKIIIAGCLPQAEDEKEMIKRYPDCSIMGVFQLDKIAHIVEETLAGNKVYFLKTGKNANRLSLPIIRRNEIIEIIPICNGCLGNCTYCKTRFARGKLVSYSEKAILQRVEFAIQSGAKEIWLTSQDLGAYGKDSGSSLPKLVEKILSVPGDFKVRLGMMNPNFAKKDIDKLLYLMGKSKKLFRFLHIPVQSGNNRILKLMGRKYRAEDFRNIVRKARKAFPEISIATDVIVGFPSETEDDFKQTLKLVEETQPDVLNISRFWPRPGTKAADMKNQVHGNVSKLWSEQMTKRFDEIALQRNRFWEGKKCEVIIDEVGKNNTLVGRNEAYKPVIVGKTNKLKLGDKINVKIKTARKYDLIS